MTDKDDNMIEICVAVKVNSDGSYWCNGWDVKHGDQSPLVKQTYHVKFKVPKPKIIVMDLADQSVYPAGKITFPPGIQAGPLVITKPLGMEVAVTPKPDGDYIKMGPEETTLEIPAPPVVPEALIGSAIPKDKTKATDKPVVVLPKPSPKLPPGVIPSVTDITIRGKHAVSDVTNKVIGKPGNSGLTRKWTQYRMEIVAYICANGPARQGEIAKALSIPVGSMTSIMVHEFFEQNANGEWMVVKSEVQVTEPSE